MTQPIIYSTTEMAEKIGVSSRTIRRWAKKGVLKPKDHPANNKPYYTEADYEEYTERLKNGTLE